MLCFWLRARSTWAPTNMTHFSDPERIGGLPGLVRLGVGLAVMPSAFFVVD